RTSNVSPPARTATTGGAPSPPGLRPSRPPSGANRGNSLTDTSCSVQAAATWFTGVTVGSSAYFQAVLAVQIQQIVPMHGFTHAIHDNDQKPLGLAVMDQHMGETSVPVQVNVLDFQLIARHRRMESADASRDVFPEGDWLVRFVGLQPPHRLNEG